MSATTLYFTFCAVTWVLFLGMIFTSLRLVVVSEHASSRSLLVRVVGIGCIFAAAMFCFCASNRARAVAGNEAVGNPIVTYEIVETDPVSLVTENVQSKLGNEEEPALRMTITLPSHGDTVFTVPASRTEIRALDDGHISPVIETYDTPMSGLLLFNDGTPCYRIYLNKSQTESIQRQEEAVKNG